MTQRERESKTKAASEGVAAGKKKTPEEIEAAIDETRTAIAEDIKELGQKLTPESLREGAKDVIRGAKEEAKAKLRSARESALDAVSETVSEVGQRALRAGKATGGFASANAVPLALVGLGAGWLMVSMRKRRAMEGRAFAPSGFGEGATWQTGYRREGARYDASLGAESFGRDAERSFEGQSLLEGDVVRESEPGAVSESLSAAQDKMREKAGQVQHKAGALTHRARERAEALSHRVQEGAEKVQESAGKLAHRVQDTAGSVGRRAFDLRQGARDRVGRAQQRTREFADENPLAMGLLALAGGVGIGLLLPTSQAENRMMGSTRDRLVGEARQTAQRVRKTARETKEDVKSALRSEASAQP